MRRPFRTLWTLLFLMPLASAWVRGAPTLADARVFPNPLRVYDGQTSMTFDNLTDQVEIRIYDTRGSLVRSESLDPSGTVFLWDLKNDEGHDIASGIYVYTLTNNSGERQKGKIAIIR
jgi:hypothetical protein